MRGVLRQRLVMVGVGVLLRRPAVALEAAFLRRRSVVLGR